MKIHGLKNLQVHIINVVWGNEFTKTFINASIPSQLSENNLQYLKKELISSTYKIYTTTNDQHTIQSSQIFEELSSSTKVEFISINPTKNNIKTMINCHNRSIKEANEKTAILFFLSPDCIISDNLFKTLISSYRNGKDLVICPSIRLAKESFLNEYYQRKDLKIPPRDLASLAIKNLHPITQSLFFENNFINRWPSHLYWKLDETALLVRGFHLHPIMIVPQKDIIPKSSIDDDYIEKNNPDTKKWKFISDSDEGFICEITTINKKEYSYSLTKKNIAYFSYFISKYIRKSHKMFIQYAYYFHSEEKKPHWKILEKNTLSIVLQILNNKLSAKDQLYFFLSSTLLPKLKKIIPYKLRRYLKKYVSK